MLNYFPDEIEHILKNKSEDRDSNFPPAKPKELLRGEKG